MRTMAELGVVEHVAGAQPNVLRELIQLSLERRDLVSLAGGLPADELFDVEGIELATRAAFRSNSRAPLQYDNTEGLAPLRERLALMSRARGVDADAQGLIVTSGSQQAIDLAARCLVAPGDAVLVERPTFITALQTFRAAQARLIDLTSDAEGPTVDSVEAGLALAAAEGRRVKLVYLIPSFSNPSGAVIGLERRRALLALARARGLTILEDDPYGELWFDRPPPPPMRALAQDEDGLAEHVIYVSSLSKIVSPGLRIGWAVLPGALMQPFRLMKSTADIHSGVLSQAIAEAYLGMGRLDARMEALRRGYAAKARALAEALARHAPGLAFATPKGGMFLWARLPAGVEATAFSRHALTQAGVSAVPGDPFFAAEPETDRLRLSFSQGGPDILAEGAARLGRALADIPAP